MISRFVDSFWSVKFGYLASFTGVAASTLVDAIPDALAIEKWLKSAVLFLTAVSLFFTIAQQAVNFISTLRK